MECSRKGLHGLVCRYGDGTEQCVVKSILQILSKKSVLLRIHIMIIHLLRNSLLTNRILGFRTGWNHSAYARNIIIFWHPGKAGELVGGKDKGDKGHHHQRPRARDSNSCSEAPSGGCRPQGGSHAGYQAADGCPQ